MATNFSYEWFKNLGVMSIINRVRVSYLSFSSLFTTFYLHLDQVFLVKINNVRTFYEIKDNKSRVENNLPFQHHFSPNQLALRALHIVFHHSKVLFLT